jgi:ATP-dependent DNA helicase RecG
VNKKELSERDICTKYITPALERAGCLWWVNFKSLLTSFHDIGFIEGWGTGFQRMVEGCVINGNPKPGLKEITGAFVVKFIRRPASEGINEGVSEGTNGGANEGISQLIEFIRKTPGKRVVEIAAVLNIPSKTIERWIKKLREQGRVVFTGPRKTGGYFISG